jgi:hypothetical protein
MKVIGRVEWTNRDKNSNPIAVVRPVVEVLKEDWRFINSDEDFPTQGQIFWLNAVEATEDSIVSCRTEPNNAPKYKYKVAEPRPIYEVIDLRSLGTAFEAREALVRGISLPGPTSSLKVLIWCSPNILVGPIELKREKAIATLVVRNAHCINVYNNPQIRSIILPNTERSHRLLRIDDNPPSGYVDWDDDLAVLRRALETAVKVAKHSGAEVAHSRKQIEEAVVAIASQGIGITVELDRYRLEHAARLLKDSGLIAQISESISEALRDHPSVKASFEELREKIRVDVESCVRKDLETRLAIERTELEATKETHSKLQLDIENAREQITEAKEKLKTIELEAERRAIEVEDAVRMRVQAAVASPKQLLADISLFRPFFNGVASSKTGFEAVGTDSIWKKWNQGEGRPVHEKKTLRKELITFARALGTDASLLMQVHCAIIANVLPVTCGSGALSALHAYVKATCAGRIHLVNVSPASISFSDIEATIEGGLNTAANIAAQIDGISILVLEGLNRSPIEASLLPYLQTKEFQQDFPEQKNGFRLAASLVSGVTTVPVTYQLWNHGVALYSESVVPTPQKLALGDASLSSELFLPGEVPKDTIDELLDVWPECNELRHMLCRYGAALNAYFQPLEIAGLLRNGLILPFVATALREDEQDDALHNVKDVDGSIALILRRLRRRLT